MALLVYNDATVDHGRPCRPRRFLLLGKKKKNITLYAHTVYGKKSGRLYLQGKKLITVIL